MIDHIPLETCSACAGSGEQGEDYCDDCNGNGYTKGCQSMVVKVGDGHGGWRDKTEWLCDHGCPVDQLAKARAKLLGHYIDRVRVRLLKDPRLGPRQAWRDNKTGELVFVDSVGYTTCGCGQRHGPYVYLYRDGEGDYFRGVYPEYLIRDYTHAPNERPRKIRRRLFRPAYAQPLVSVQPMSLPQGTLFLDAVYKSGQGDTQTTTELLRQAVDLVNGEDS